MLRITGSNTQPTPDRAVNQPDTGTGTGTGTDTQLNTRARLTDSGQAASYLQDSYIPGLHTFAQVFEASIGRKPSDQDFPVELVRLVPASPTLAPLVILGGMGPLAGAQAMQAAIDRFGDTREIVLLQLCNVPDRTAALNEDLRLGVPSDQHREVVVALAKGLGMVDGVLETLRSGTVHVVVACNTAHNFAPEAFDRYRQDRGLQLLDSGREARLLHEHAGRNEENKGSEDEVEESSAEMKSVDVI